MFLRLSDQSRYLYFCAGVPANETWAERFATLGCADGKTSHALVAEPGDARDGDREIIGLARFARSAQGQSADIGILLADAWQSRGLGGFVLDRLRLEARRRAVAVFRGQCTLGEPADAAPRAAQLPPSGARLLPRRLRPHDNPRLQQCAHRHRQVPREYNPRRDHLDSPSLGHTGPCVLGTASVDCERKGLTCMEYDVLIVGGRVAGASLALLLAQRGHRVLMIDRDQFPSDTLSTHYLSPF